MRDELFISSQLFQATFDAAGRVAVPARDDTHEFEWKVCPDEFTSCPPSVFFEPPLQIVRRPDVDIIVSAPQGVYAPIFIAACHTAHYVLWTAILLGCPSLVND